jgi:hypothetical protein
LLAPVTPDNHQIKSVLLDVLRQGSRRIVGHHRVNLKARPWVPAAVVWDKPTCEILTLGLGGQLEVLLCLGVSWGPYDGQHVDLAVEISSQSQGGAQCLLRPFTPVVTDEDMPKDPSGYLTEFVFGHFASPLQRSAAVSARQTSNANNMYAT